MKTRTFFILVTTITIIFIFSIIYRETYKLDEPIVFEHKYELGIINNKVQAQLHYLTGKEKNIDIYRIDFDNLDTEIFVNTNNNFTFNTYSNVYQTHKDYLHKTVSINQDLDESDILRLKTGSIELDYATVYYTDGTKRYVNIGKIFINEYDHETSIPMSYGESSNNGKSKTGFNINGKKIMLNVSSNFLSDLLTEFVVIINNNIIKRDDLVESGTKIIINEEVGGYLVVNSNRNQDVNPYVFQHYTLNILLDNGKVAKAHIIEYPHFNNKELRIYVKERTTNNE